MFIHQLILGLALLGSASPAISIATATANGPEINSPAAAAEQEYCYTLTFGTSIGEITAVACGDSPQEGLNALGEAVRAWAPAK